MNAEELRSLQAPVKERYRQQPETALVTLRAEGRLGEGVVCKIETGKRWSKPGFILLLVATVSARARATCCSKHWSDALVSL